MFQSQSKRLIPIILILALCSESTLGYLPTITRSRLFFVVSGKKEGPCRSLRGGISSLLLSNKRRLNGEASSEISDFQFSLLKRENELLRETVRQLEIENSRLKSLGSARIVLETFEGEGRPETHWYDTVSPRRNPAMPHSGTITPAPPAEGNGVSSSGFDTDLPELWCDELEDGACPLEPNLSFAEAMRDRSFWLVGLLAFQSCSGFILSRNEALLETHPVIIYFLTMLVGVSFLSSYLLHKLPR